MHRLLAGLALLGLAGCCTPCAQRRQAEATREARALRPPGFRWCCFFGHDLLTPVVPAFRFDNTVAPARLAGHVYGGALREDNGVLYTRRGGFLDTGHLRDYADWTGYLALRLEEEAGESLVLSLPDQGTTRTALRVPRVPRDAETRLRLAQRIAYEYSVWHEVATWYGWSTAAVFSERVSAFSPEDLYSNLLGVWVGAEAWRRGGRPGSASWGPAVDAALARHLRLLDAQEPEATRAAFDAVEGPGAWWERAVSVNDVRAVGRRHMQVEEVVAPWLVEAGSLALPVPRHGPLGRVLLSDLYRLEYELDPAQLPDLVARAGRRLTSRDVPGLLPAIRDQARQELGALADRPDLPRRLERGGERFAVYRDREGGWQLCHDARRRRGWRRLHQRAFNERAALRRYLAAEGGSGPDLTWWQVDALLGSP